MPNIVKVLREEIARLGRKESKAVFIPLQRRTIRLERASAGLKRRAALLEKDNHRLQARVARLETTQPEAPASEEPSGRAWISGKGIKSLRRKLGLSQRQFAKLVGVSLQSVGNWESQAGTLKLRKATKASVLSLRGIGAREAKRRLEAPKPKTSIRK